MKVQINCKFKEFAPSNAPFDGTRPTIFPIFRLREQFISAGSVFVPGEIASHVICLKASKGDRQ